jgi:hypothetical protein
VLASGLVGIGVARCRVGVNRLGCKRLQEGARAFEVTLAGGAQQAVGADFGEPLGKHVLEESGDEASRGERQAPGACAPRIGVAEGDLVVLEALDAMVGESDAVDVAGEIEGGLVAGADLVDVDVPGFRADLTRDLLKEL